MSLVEDLKAKVVPKSPSPADIKTDLTLAEAALADLESQHGSAALDAMGNVAGAEGRLRDLETKLASQRQRAATLRAAHAAAVRREADQLAEQRASIRRTQYRAMAVHLRERDKAAKALGEALEVASANYRSLIEHSGKARSACPAGAQFPMGAHCEDGEIKLLVQTELYRVSGKGGPIDRFKLPGAISPSPLAEYQPDKIKPLADAIREGSKFAADKLKVE